MSQSPAAASSPPASPAKGEPRYLILLLLTVVVALVGGLVTAATFGALLSFVPAVVGMALGAVVGFGLPIFLAVRAARALRRRKSGLLLRRLVVLALIAATQIAITGAILQYSPRNTGHVAYTAAQVLDLFGGVPVVSDLLFAHAERNNAIPGTELDRKHGKKGHPAVGPDGGVLVDAADGGVHASADGGVHVSADGGVAAAGPVDAGTAVASAASHGPAAPRPKPGIGLSPRAEGKAARTFAASVSTSSGDTVLIVGTVGAGGTFTSRVVDLSAHEKLGEPSVVECADDGTVAAILGGSHLVVARAGKSTADVVKSLEPGQKLDGKEIQSVRDVVVGAGGSGLALVELLAGQNGEVVEELVTLPKGNAPATVLRKAGDKIPGSATDTTVAKSWSFKKSSGAGSVLVAETYLEGGDDVGTRMSGEVFLLNPERLLVVKLDAPKALVEIAKTGTEPSGIDGKELQIFGDAWLLPDGRALFDANFLEKGADGWLFLTKPAGGLFSVAPELGDKAPWTSSPPRVKHLEAGSDGTVIFRREDGAVAVTSVEKPAEVSAALLGADALGQDGHRLGAVASVDVPILARGGEWIIASAQLKGATTHDAIVLASRADVQNGKAEVLLEVGAKLPEPAAKGAKAKDRTIQAIRFMKGRDELLWQR